MPHKQYTLSQLLDDSYFISSVKNPTLESDIFWKDAIQKGYLTERTYTIAKTFIMSVQPDKLEKDQKEIMWEKINVRNSHKRGRISTSLWITFSSVAACFILLVTLSTIYLQGSSPEEDILSIIEKPKTADNHIQLIFSDDKPLAIKEKNANIQYTEKGEILVNSDILEKEYHTSESFSQNEPETYNQLIVPKGQQSSLILSDGTKIWVNAGSRLIYPPLFTKKERIVHVEGEVFLDVFHDSKRPFIVKAKGFDIHVTGTSFCLSSYEDIKEQSVVLVEGAVKIKTKNRKEEITLSPNQKLTYKDSKYDIETVNTSIYTAWKNGFYQYRSEAISDIVRKLSHYYGRHIYCDDKVASITCSGKLDLKQDIEKVLDTLCKGAVPMTFYEKEDSYYIKQAE